VFPSRPLSAVGFGVALCLAAPFSTAISAPIIWAQRTTNSASTSYEASTIAADKAGNVAVTGRFTNNRFAGNPDHFIYAAKYAGTDGRQIWQYTGSPRNGARDAGRIVRTDSANNVFVGGVQDSRIRILKLDGSDGHVLWEAPATTDFFNTSNVVAMEIDSNNDVLVAATRTPINPVNGYVLNYFMTTKFAGTDGHVIWQQGYSGPSTPSDLALDPTGNAIVSGSARRPDSQQPTDPYEFLVIEYDAADGHVRWEHRRPESGIAQHVASDADGNAIVAGTLDVQVDQITEKLAAADGHSLWTQVTTGYPRRGILDLAVDKKGDAVIAGHDAAGNDHWTFYTAKFSGKDGVNIWERRTRPPMDNYQGAEAVAIRLDPHDNPYVLGYWNFPPALQYENYIAAYAATDGTTLWEQRYAAADPAEIFPVSHTLLPDGNLAVLSSVGGPYQYDFFTIKYSTASQLLNIAARANVLQHDDALFAGFIVTGSAPKRVLVRALGPSLPMSETLADPVLELHLADGTTLSNDNWKDTQQAEIAATNIPPPNEKESAIVATVPPGAHTALVGGIGNSTGIGLLEVYDLDPAAPSTAANISTRSHVGTADNVLIGGVILRGPRGSTILARAIGPSLSGAGVKDALQDPTLELVDANGSSFHNDDWKRNSDGSADPVQQSRIEATGVAPSDDRESALLVTLAPGPYTAIVRGKNNTTGVGLVEFYNLEGSPSSGGTFSFESDLEGWTPKGTDLNSPPIQWSIAPSQDRATDGTRSLKFELWNYNDAGKIWIERPFSVEPNKTYHVTVQFTLGTQDWGDANHFTIIAGVRTSPAVTRDDLTYQDLTGNGEHTNTGYKWLEKSYDFHLVSGSDGTLYLDIGIWGTWETARTYYIDNVRVSVSEN
jgi:hypothetical protein